MSESRPECRTLVVGALPQEVQPLVRQLRDRQRIELGGYRAWSGRCGDRTVTAMATGVGMSAAARAVAVACEAFRPERLIGIGLAGALTPELRVGSLLLARQILVCRETADKDSLPELVAPSGELDERLRRDGAMDVTLVSSARIVSSAAGKSELAREFRLASRGAVDLESYGWARAAAECGVEWTILRSVSDELGEDLALDFEAFRNPDGQLDTARLVVYAVVRPQLWSGLAALQRRLRTGAERLASTVVGVLE